MALNPAPLKAKWKSNLPPHHTSAAMGTVLLTGFDMMATQAVGHALATASQRPLTIDALMLNRSSRVMPGLRGTPVGVRRSEELILFRV